MREPKMNENEVDQSTEATFWYVLTDSRQFGPIFFSRLRQMAHQGKLSRDDKARKGTEGEWVLIGDLNDVLFPTAAELESMSAREAVAEQKPESQVQEPGFLAIFANSIRDRIEVFYESVVHGIADRLSLIRTIISWIALIAVFVSLATVMTNQTPSEWFFTVDPIKIYTSIWDELIAKRQANVSSAEWDKFAAEARRDITRIVARLERTASSEDRSSQQLLWAGRDYLMKMLDDARDDVSQSEERFELELQRAIWLQQGNAISEPQLYRKRLPVFMGFISDNGPIVLGVAFVIFNVGIVVWFLTERRKK
jgi:hypothetical protein